MKGNYNAKFLYDDSFRSLRNATLPLCIRHCKLSMQSLPVMMVLLNLQQDLASLEFLRFQSDVNFKLTLLIVSPSRGRSDG